MGEGNRSQQKEINKEIFTTDDAVTIEEGNSLQKKTKRCTSSNPYQGPILLTCYFRHPVVIDKKKQ